MNIRTEGRQNHHRSAYWGRMQKLLIYATLGRPHCVRALLRTSCQPYEPGSKVQSSKAASLLSAQPGHGCLRPSRSLNRSSSLLESGRQAGCGYRPSWAISRSQRVLTSQVLRLQPTTSADRIAARQRVVIRSACCRRARRSGGLSVVKTVSSRVPGELPTASSIGWFRSYDWLVGSVQRASLRRRKSRLARSRLTRRKRRAVGWSASCSPAAQRNTVRASMPSSCAPSPAPSAEAACLPFGTSRTRTRNERVG